MVGAGGDAGRLQLRGVLHARVGPHGRAQPRQRQQRLRATAEVQIYLPSYPFCHNLERRHLTSPGTLYGEADGSGTSLHGLSRACQVAKVHQFCARHLDHELSPCCAGTTVTLHMPPCQRGRPAKRLLLALPQAPLAGGSLRRSCGRLLLPHSPSNSTGTRLRRSPGSRRSNSRSSSVVPP